jgi:hypothetical protein
MGFEGTYENMEKMDGALDEPISDDSFIAGHLHYDAPVPVRSPDGTHKSMTSEEATALFEAYCEQWEAENSQGEQVTGK